ncbi:MAG TPA: DNA-directed RNA polymerase subunit omega [Atribacterota bacterium]|nr:DNA-directed RNA polymerase subunit omega [Atribacterota bacterium]HOR41722.1 DNA-directed RNA polymerase subunit omega [Atribacterota bacterium]HPK86429.1 DNA-directed RNA polymerase subunit omega [Atribacterota bacterium]
MEKNDYSDNKYLLTVMVAKRAKQLNQGFKALVKTNDKNSRLVALKEILEGKVYIKEEDKDIELAKLEC